MQCFLQCIRLELPLPHTSWAPRPDSTARVSRLCLGPCKKCLNVYRNRPAFSSLWKVHRRRRHGVFDQVTGTISRSWISIKAYEISSIPPISPLKKGESLICPSKSPLGIPLNQSRHYGGDECSMLIDGSFAIEAAGMVHCLIVRCNAVDGGSVCNEDRSLSLCTCSAGYTGSTCGVCELPSGVNKIYHAHPADGICDIENTYPLSHSCALFPIFNHL